MRAEFDGKAGKRLKDLHNWTTTKKKERPDWMGEQIYEQMMKNANSKEFKARSNRASANRRGGDIANAIPPSHCQGSITASQRAKKLVSLF